MKYLITIIFILLSLSISATTISTISNGNWNNPNIWSTGNVPSNNDTVLVDDEIIINNNYGTYTNMVIIVTGKISINSGRKLYLSSNSIVYIDGGKIEGGNGGSKIFIGATEIYNGDGSNLEGFKTCTNLGCNVSSPLPIKLLYFRVYNIQNTACIEWENEVEIDVDYFNIERSFNTKEWEIIYQVKPLGQNIPYYVYDTPNQSVYYKLVEVDINGEHQDHEISFFTHSKSNKSPMRIIDIMGRDVDLATPGLKIIIYPDGSTLKIIM